MADILYPYYERELHFIRQHAKEFAKKYPAAAGRLLIDENRSADPHVERMIESFALLAGRIHHKLDDDFPELTDALLNILYPFYLAPIPSMAIAELEINPQQAQLPKGLLLEKQTRLHTQAIGDMVCRFRTVYPLHLWPIKVNRASLLPPPLPAAYKPPPSAAAALVLELECQGGLQFADLSLDRLRFHLAGEDQITAALYELIFNQAIGVLFRPLDGSTNGAPVSLEPGDAIFDVGFGVDEGMLPHPEQAFPGYRLLMEYFTFPSKFLFFDLAGFRQVAAAQFRRRMEVVLFVRQSMAALEQSVNASTFRLGCTPIVNLFSHLAEPIPLKRTEFEYRVVPDAAHPRAMEVYSLDSVLGTESTTDRVTDFQPYFSFQHGSSGLQSQAFWHASRRRSEVEGDRGTEVHVHLVDLAYNPRSPSDTILSVKTTCTNRDLPMQIQMAGQKLQFELEAAAPIARISCVRPATPSLRPLGRRGGYWRLISHLALNHLSIANATEGREALREILRLYDFSDPESGAQFRAVNRQLIDGIASVTSRRVVGHTGCATSSGFCRGVEVTIEFDATNYVGTGVYLFASVLERFLGLYASLNSFTQLVAKIKQSEGILRQWPPRAGERQLL